MTQLENGKFLTGFLKILSVRNQFPISFGTAFVCDKTKKVRNSYPPIHLTSCYTSTLKQNGSENSI